MCIFWVSKLIDDIKFVHFIYRLTSSAAFYCVFNFPKCGSSYFLIFFPLFPKFFWNLHTHLQTKQLYIVKPKHENFFLIFRGHVGTLGPFLIGRRGTFFLQRWNWEGLWRYENLKFLKSEISNLKNLWNNRLLFLLDSLSHTYLRDLFCDIDYLIFSRWRHNWQCW